MFVKCETYQVERLWQWKGRTQRPMIDYESLAGNSRVYLYTRDIIHHRYCTSYTIVRQTTKIKDRV